MWSFGTSNRKTIKHKLYISCAGEILLGFVITALSIAGSAVYDPVFLIFIPLLMSSTFLGYLAATASHKDTDIRFISIKVTCLVNPILYMLGLIGTFLRVSFHRNQVPGHPIVIHILLILVLICVSSLSIYIFLSIGQLERASRDILEDENENESPLLDELESQGELPEGIQAETNSEIEEETPNASYGEEVHEMQEGTQENHQTN
eukprot:gb/GECH01008213.1/.p1 GENE.gb/GECH01008213.1/~~gb/GECH01008213.1/.p1  ORF type:complete len:206 (+),score=37.94 gb/GECH01008213.1/:1-618(+)